MKGSVRQRGTSSWELRVYVGTDPGSGRRRWATRTVRGSRSEAERELARLAAQANVAPALGARTTMGELLDQWYARGCAGWSPATARNVGSIVERHLRPHLGHLLVGDLTAAMVDDFYAKLRVDGRGDGEPLSVGTVRRIHSTLHSALAQGQRWGWVFDNVAAHAAPPREGQPELRPPTPEELARLLAFTRESDASLHLYLVLAATTGARRGQLLALRWADIDLVSGRLRIQRAVIEGPDGPVLVPTKTRRRYQVALDHASLGLLRVHHEATPEEARAGDRFVFAAVLTGERPWKPNFVTKRFIDARRGAGLPHFRLHDLRHFMATQMLDAGVPVPIVAARLAHARASTTLNFYGHAVPVGDLVAAETLWMRIAEAGGDRDAGDAGGAETP